MPFAPTVLAAEAFDDPVQEDKAWPAGKGQSDSTRQLIFPSVLGVARLGHRFVSWCGVRRRGSRFNARLARYPPHEGRLASTSFGPLPRGRPNPRLRRPPVLRRPGLFTIAIVGPGALVVLVQCHHLLSVLCPSAGGSRPGGGSVSPQ